MIRTVRLIAAMTRGQTPRSVKKRAPGRGDGPNPKAEPLEAPGEAHSGHSQNQTGDRQGTQGAHGVDQKGGIRFSQPGATCAARRPKVHSVSSQTKNTANGSRPPCCSAGAGIGPGRSGPGRCSEPPGEHRDARGHRDQVRPGGRRNLLFNSVRHSSRFTFVIADVLW
jgi:hypothetical protein